MPRTQSSRDESHHCQVAVALVYLVYLVVDDVEPTINCPAGDQVDTTSSILDHATDHARFADSQDDAPQIRLDQCDQPGTKS